VPKTALIVGITGPDGAYLARFLLDKVMTFTVRRETSVSRVPMVCERLASATR